MVPLSTLWLPILLSAVIVFVASSILHMLLPFHKSDYRKLPDEDKVLDSLRAASVTPGRVYVFPFAAMKDMKAPETIEKFKRGPSGMLSIRPSAVPAMGKYLGQWFIYCVFVSFVTACLTGRRLAPGTHYHTVFHFAGAAAFLAYGIGQIPNAIWRGETWGVTLKHVIDGLIYSLLTAGTFGWLWPR